MHLAQSLKTKLVLLFVIVTTVLLGLSSLAHYRHSKQRLESRLQMQLDAASARLGYGLPVAIWNFDPQLQHRTLVSEMSDPTIVGITVKDQTGKLTGVTRGADGSVVPIEAELSADIVRPMPLMYGSDEKKKQVGTATVYASTDQIDAALRSDLRWEAMQALVLQVVLVFALTQLLGAVVLRPLAQLRDALNDISSGQADLTRRLPTGTSAEFAAVSQGFNRFVAQLESIVSSVLKQSETVAAGSQQIATGSHDLSSRTEAHANGLQSAATEVAALIEGVESNAKHAGQAFELVHNASSVAEEGGALVSKVVSTMRGISDSSKKIVDIIGVINGIAFQTNILALNAAVEAARAGEQGRGFAVVASEVRGLAGRCAEAAKEINSLIHSSVQEVETGCSHVETAGATMHQIVQSIHEVNAVVHQIAAASREQSKAIAQVGLRLAQMDDVTQRNNAMAEETSTAANSLRDSASGLFQAVGMFKVGA